MGKKLFKNSVGFAVAIGFVLGVIWLIAVRFVAYESEAVHHHANFAVYINGEQEPFDSFAYYEEVQSCGGEEMFNPKIRAHMHEQINSVVHVHDSGATWGHFFANLGYTLGNDLISTEDGTYASDESNTLSFILNGNESANIANQAIRSEDVLLINYGADDEDVLRERFDAIDVTAGEYNGKYDPAACAGGKPLTFGERLKEAVGVF